MDDKQLEAIVLAGGKGTRLQSVVSDRPKSLAVVAGRPFLEWLLLALHTRGIRRVVLATGYKGEMVQAYFGDGARVGLNICYAQEAVPLGTGGAARYAALQSTVRRVLVLNGDSYCPFDVARLVDVQRRTGARAALWLVPMDDCRRYGAVDAAADGRVVAFHEKSPALGAGTINAGVYLFDRGLLTGLPADVAISLETAVFPALIGQGLYATVGEGPFLDIGTPESYHLADAFFASLAPSLLG